MGRAVVVLVAIAAMAGLPDGVAWGSQSLGEVAEREKQRREQLDETGVVPVIREEELSSTSGAGMSVMGRRPEAPSSDSIASGGGGDEDEASSAEAGASLDKRNRDLREAWDRIWRTQLERAERDVKQTKEDAYQCAAASRYFYPVPVAVNCDGVDLRVARAEQRLREVKRNRYNWELLLPEDERSSTP